MLNRMLNTTIQLRGWFDAKEEQILAVGNYRIFDFGEFHFHDGNSSEKTYIRFSDLLWQILTENCVPLSREIATQLGRSPRALDIYQWLAYRTYALKSPPLYLGKTFEASSIQWIRLCILSNGIFAGRWGRCRRHGRN